MAGQCPKLLDPRVRRTRQLLADALQKLLETKRFDELSILDIAGAATVNRATFYDHYPDKFALLECMVGNRFHELLTRRQVTFDGTCASALHAVVLGVCDYLAALPALEGEHQSQLAPHLENAIITVVRATIFDGLANHPPAHAVPLEMTAATVSWAIYGAAREWVRTPDRPTSDQAADMVMTLIAPILGLPAAACPPVHCSR